MTKDFIKAIKILVLVGISALIYISLFIFISVKFAPRIWWISEKQEKTIEETYDLNLPKDYKFVKGVTEYGWDQVNCDEIYIIINSKDFEEMFGESWTKTGEARTGSSINFMGEPVDVLYEKRSIQNSYKSFADLYYNVSDEKIHCYFRFAYESK